MGVYNIKFSPEKRKDVKGKLIKKNVPIRVTLTFDKKRFQTTTGVRCNIDQWSYQTGKFKSSAANSTSKNEILKNIAEKLEGIYLAHQSKGDHITVELIRNEYRNKQELGFFDYFDEFVRVEGNNNGWSTGTRAKFKTLRKHLGNFSKAKSITMEFGNIDYTFYQSMFDYFVELGHINATIKKTFKNFNWFVGWVIKTKKFKVADYNCFTVKDVSSQSKTGTPLNMVFLTPDEFILMFEAIIPDLRLSKVKDMFCFMCASGLRFSDFAALKPDNITDENIIITTKKTADPITIPLNEFSRAILKKYEDNPMIDLLPKISNPKFNLYIKELAQLLGFNRKITKVFIKAGETVRDEKPLYERISTHAARKTFVSLSVFLNMNTDVLMRFTGHKEYNTLKQYLGIDDSEKRREMGLFTMEGIKTKIAN